MPVFVPLPKPDNILRSATKRVFPDTCPHQGPVARQMVAGDKLDYFPQPKCNQLRFNREGVKREPDFCGRVLSCGLSLGSTRFFCHKRNGWKVQSRRLPAPGPCGPANRRWRQIRQTPSAKPQPTAAYRGESRGARHWQPGPSGGVSFGYFSFAVERKVTVLPSRPQAEKCSFAYFS